MKGVKKGMKDNLSKQGQKVEVEQGIVNHLLMIAVTVQIQIVINREEGAGDEDAQGEEMIPQPMTTVTGLMVVVRQ